VLERVPALVESVTRSGKVRLVAQDLGSVGSMDDIRLLVTTVRERLGSDPAVVALAGIVNDKPVVMVATNQAARDTGARAGVLAKDAARVLGGGGGGKDDLAQGGGSDTGAIGAALAGITNAVSG
jgi:alanyl-tRNA synthetase